MGSNARGLAKLRNPVAASTGGLSPDHLSGLNWRCDIDNWVTVEAGVAVCPYSTGWRPVVITAPVSVNIPTQAAGIVRAHLWLHSDAGTPTIAFDVGTLGNNYFGSAYGHPSNDGWRYLGSVLLGTGRNPIRQQCINKQVLFTSNIAGAPFELVSVTGQTTARQFSTDPVAPASITSIIMTLASSGAVWRVAASAATCGFTVSNSIFTNAVTSASADVTIAVGTDRLIQYASDAAGGALVGRAVGYNFKR